jgi:hypothetical protein
VNAWNALSGGYGVETVEDCVIETQPGVREVAHADRALWRRCNGGQGHENSTGYERVVGQVLQHLVLGRRGAPEDRK